MGGAAGGDPGHRPDPRPGRAVLHAESRRSRRRGVEDRAAGARGRDAAFPALCRGREPLFPRHQSQQKEPRHRPAAASGRRHPARSRRRRGHPRRELPPRRDGPARARLRDAGGDQPAPHLLRDQRLWPRGPAAGQAVFRHCDASLVGCAQHQWRAGSYAGEARHTVGRHGRRGIWADGDPRRIARADTDRARAAHRYQPA